MRWFKGFFPAIVLDNQDPEKSGRVKVRLPGLAGHETWARLSAFAAGDHQGAWFPPEVNTEVLVAFEGGAAGQSYVLGGLWSQSSPPPETTGAQQMLRSRNGLTIRLDDQAGQESFSVSTPGGQKLTLKDGPGVLEITDSNGNAIRLEASGVSVTAAAKVTVNASQVEVNAGLLNVNAGLAKFSGVVQCDTLISNSVVSASYTPGAGNLA